MIEIFETAKQSRICIDCNQRFTPIDDYNNFEIRCTEHQIEFRKKQADQMHKTKKFYHYFHGGVMIKTS